MTGHEHRARARAVRYRGWQHPDLRDRVPLGVALADAQDLYWACYSRSLMGQAGRLVTWKCLGPNHWRATLSSPAVPTARYVAEGYSRCVAIGAAANLADALIARIQPGGRGLALPRQPVTTESIG